MKKLAAILLCGVMLLTSCGNTSKTAKGGLIGSGAGMAAGAVIGYLITGDAQGAAIGAAVGTAVGGGAGAAIGNAMDKKADELAALEDAKVETITDKNGLTAIKVTFSSGLLFAVNKADLSADAKAELTEFASQMSDLPDTDITIYGHTDNTGSASVNERLSLKRAKAVVSVSSQILNVARIQVSAIKTADACGFLNEEMPALLSVKDSKAVLKGKQKKMISNALEQRA